MIDNSYSVWVAMKNHCRIVDKQKVVDYRLAVKASFLGPDSRCVSVSNDCVAVALVPMKCQCALGVHSNAFTSFCVLANSDF
jgi:hypothetical protein